MGALSNSRGTSSQKRGRIVARSTNPDELQNFRASQAIPLQLRYLQFWAAPPKLVSHAMHAPQHAEGFLVRDVGDAHMCCNACDCAPPIGVNVYLSDGV